MTDLNEVLANTVTNIEALVAQYGEQAVELSGTILQYEAMHLLIQPIYLAVFAVIAGLISVRFVKQAIHLEKENRNEGNPQFAVGVIAGMSSGIGAIGALITGAEGLFRPAVWAAAFDPYMAIAAKALGVL